VFDFRNFLFFGSPFSNSCVRYWATVPSFYIKIRSSETYKELKVLKFDDILKFEVGLFAYYYFNNKLPHIFDIYFIKLSECRTVNTRRQAIGCNCIPRYKTSKQQHSIKYQGAQIEIQLKIFFSQIKKKKKNLKNI